MTRYVVGIDPGLSGGVALLEWDASGSAISVTPMPVRLLLPPPAAPARRRKGGAKGSAAPLKKRKRKAGVRRAVDVAALQATLDAFRLPLESCSLVAVERVTPRPLEASTSTLTSGMLFGQLLGLFETRGLLPRLRLVMARHWKDRVLAGTLQDKEAAIAYCSRTFPGVKLLPSPRHRKPHDGMADAACIAVYARTIVEAAPE